MSTKVPNRIYLTEDRVPKQWYNMRADMPEQQPPYLNPATLAPAQPHELEAIFAKELCRQEMTDERYVDIPEEILEYYKFYRPSPVIRAYTLEKLLDTPAKIYYKYEGNNTSGSHKLNSAVPQVYYNKKQGIKGLTTETGAGQWGTALAMACAHFDLPLEVYMVRVSFEQKPHRKAIMETYGAQVFPSPGNRTDIGRAILEKDPNNTGSLGTAISEAIEVAVKTPDTRYTLGSVLNQVVLHQSIIGLESKAQLESVDEYPDYVIGCAGGGSNLGGLIAPFMQDRLLGKKSPYFIAVEPSACPSFTRGKYAYDFCDVGHVTPLAKMYTLGSGFIPASIHAGGLRYHGMSPLLSKLYNDGYLDEARAYGQRDVFEAGVAFAKAETILPAPESSHAIKAAIDVALECRESGEAKTILFGLTGNGYFDMSAYSAYNEGGMENFAPSDEDIAKSLADLPKVGK